MIHFQDVSMVYPDGTKALSSVDLHFERGEFAFITGASGSGKSTLLELIYREMEPTGGEVIVDGQDVSKLPRGLVPLLRRKVGWSSRTSACCRSARCGKTSASPWT